MLLPEYSGELFVIFVFQRNMNCSTRSLGFRARQRAVGGKAEMQGTQGMKATVPYLEPLESG